MNNQTAKVSVIIPVYNAEKYLVKCLDSVCNQTYKNLEIILINDGSLDSSALICEQYAARDKRIIFVSKENEGQGKARNLGLDIMTGDYVIFVDSDDYVHIQMIELLLQTSIKYQADMVQCQLREVMVDEEQNYQFCISNIDDKIRPEQSSKERVLCYYTTDVTPTNKMFNKELLVGNRFPEGMVYEDKHLMFRLRHLATRIVYLDMPLYYYVQSPNSTMRQEMGKKQFASFFRLSEELLEYCREHNLIENYKSELSGYFRKYLSIYFRTYKYPDFEKYHRLALEKLKVHLPELKNNKYVVGKYRLIVRCLSIDFNVTMGVFLFFNKIRRMVKRI